MQICLRLGNGSSVAKKKVHSCHSISGKYCHSSFRVRYARIAHNGHGVPRVTIPTYQHQVLKSMHDNLWSKLFLYHFLPNDLPHRHQLLPTHAGHMLLFVWGINNCTGRTEVEKITNTFCVATLFRKLALPSDILQKLTRHPCIRTHPACLVHSIILPPCS